MKKLIALFTLFCLPFLVSAQLGTKKYKGPYTAQNGVVFIPGDKIVFGAGSRPTGEFTHVFKVTGWPAQIVHFQAGYSGRSLPLKGFRMAKGEFGEIIYGVVSPGYGIDFLVDIENAIKTGEIITDTTKIKNPQ